MTKRTAAKYKIDRRMGENIWGRAKSPINKREYGPGQHGQRRKGKLSGFGTRLRVPAWGAVTLIDRELFRFTEIWAAAGHPNGVFQLTPDELVALTAAPVADVVVAVP